MKALAMLAWLAVAVYFQSGPLFFAFVVVLAIGMGTQLWLRGVAGDLRATRVLEPRLFFGEKSTVTIIVENRSVFPVPWLEATESMPIGLRIADRCTHVLALGAGQSERFTYELVGRQRGLHSAGPLVLSFGDVFGIARRELALPSPQYTLVYPRILALQELDLPAVAMFGDLRSRRPLIGDPARPSGVREYRAGDPLHDIHWRATAASGSLQVKLFDPATTVQTMIYLDLDRTGYPDANLFASSELAISVAATIAQRLTDLRQAVGLATNGRLTPTENVPGADQRDLLEAMAVTAVESATATDSAGIIPPALMPSKGRTQLMRLLEVLARIELAVARPLLRDLESKQMPLPWGSTLIVVTGFVDDALLVALHVLHKTGLLIVLLVVAQSGVAADVESRARSLGIHARGVWTDAQFLAVSA